MKQYLRNYIYIVRIDHIDRRVKLYCAICGVETYIKPNDDSPGVTIAMIDEELSDHLH
jgi:hypothetical protein